MKAVLKVAQNFLKYSYDFSSVQVNLPENIANEIYTWGLKHIPDNILSEKGRESQIHITVKYGLHITDFTMVRNLFINFVKPICVTLKKITLFNNEDCDVVKINVSSPDLIKLNKLISNEFETTDTYPNYIPHVTVAYIKKGYDNIYNNLNVFEGRKIFIGSVEFSGRDNRKTIFNFL